MFQFLAGILFGPNNGVYILDEEWDSLIILDACRYDVFRNIIETNRMPGRLEYRISRGTDTSTFLKENFLRYNSPKLKEVVYVSANPFADLLIKNRVYKVISVWKYAWDEKFNTVPPEYTYYYALIAARKYPEKRLIIHFIQPHFPYLGPFEPINHKLKDHMRRLHLQAKRMHTEETNILINILTMLKNATKMLVRRKIYTFEAFAEIDPQHHLKAYKSNLEIVFTYAKKLAILLDGTTVITSDHGEAFGEPLHKLLPLRVYGHVPGIRIEPVVKVPWHVIQEHEKEQLIPKKDLVFQREHEIAVKKILSQKTRLALRYRTRQQIMQRGGFSQAQNYDAPSL